MIKTTYNHKEAYQCEECGLHYVAGAQATKCETWCTEHHSCNLEIIASALENKLTLD